MKIYSKTHLTVFYFIALKSYIGRCNKFKFQTTYCYKSIAMEKSNFLKSKEFHFLLPFVVILGIITIVKAGYAFGQWLQHIN